MLDVEAFDKFLSESSVKPTHIYGHPEAMAHVYGMHPAVQLWYARWYNGRNKWRKISQHHPLPKKKAVLAGKAWLREGPLKGGCRLSIKIESIGGYLYANGEVLMQTPDLT